MAFRPNNNLIEGVLSNAIAGKVSGWIDFYRDGKSPLHCTLELDGDFHDEIRGRTIHFWNDSPTDMGVDGSLDRTEPGIMDPMAPAQEGTVGDISFPKERWLYVEWYSGRNGRAVLEIDPQCVEVLGDIVDLATLPPRKSHPEAFDGFMRQVAVALRKETKDPAAGIIVITGKGARSTDEEKRN